jgi:hypothetical protein
MSKICRCGNAIHPVRIKYNYNTCVSCSNTESYGCVPITNHKTGNSIQIMSKSQAEVIRKSSMRKGYGTCLR